MRVKPDKYLANSSRIYGGFRGTHASIWNHFAHLDIYAEEGGYEYGSS